MAIIKLHSFNCRGLQDYCKRTKIFRYTRSIGSDILFLQETHADTNDEKIVKIPVVRKRIFACFSSNSKCVAINFRNSINLKIKGNYKDLNGRSLILNTLLNDIPVTLVNVYGPNQDDADFLLKVFVEIDICIYA